MYVYNYMQEYSNLRRENERLNNEVKRLTLENMELAKQNKLKNSIPWIKKVQEPYEEITYEIDGIEKNFFGEQKNPRAVGQKLDWEKVSSIRNKHKNRIPCTELAKEFNVSESTINRVVKNRAWKEQR